MAPVPVELADIAPHDEDQGNPEEVSIESIKLENRNIAAEIAALLAEDDEEEKEVVAPLAPLRKKRSVAVSDPEDSSGKRNSSSGKSESPSKCSPRQCGRSRQSTRHGFLVHRLGDRASDLVVQFFVRLHHEDLTTILF